MSIGYKRLHLVIAANFISDSGGVAKAARSQIIALADHYQITVVTAGGQIEHPNVAINNVEIPKLFWLRRYSHAIRETIFCRRVSKSLKHIHSNKTIDFIIFHSHTGCALAGLNFKKAYSVPFAVVTHGNIFTRPAGTYDYFLTALYKWATRLSYKKTPLIIALSPFMKGAAIQNGASPEQVSLIPNGISDSKVRSTESEWQEKWPHKPLKLLYVGRISVEKDVSTLLRGVAKACETNNKLTLTIAGDGPLRVDCEQLTTQLGIQDNVFFLGHVAPDQLAQHYLRHDIFCITSISDPLPTVVLEAMQYELPVIASNVDGLSYMVEHRKTGYLIAPKQDKEFAVAIQYFTQSPELIKQYGQAGRNKVEQQFDWSKIAVELREAIENTIHRNKNR